MSQDPEIPSAVSDDIGELVESLAQLGVRSTKAEYVAASFSNYFVEFCAPIRVVSTCSRSKPVLCGWPT
jgi:hypothetical protein